MITTPRLILRPWRDEDAAPFAALNADPAVMEQFPALLTSAESAAMCERIRSQFTREPFGLWAVEVPGIAPFIGFTGLSRPAWWPEVVEVGWRLAHAYWGEGYATEAARAALDWGFRSVALDEIVAFVVPSNVRSQRVMDRLGMKRDFDGDFDHPNVPVGHRLRRHWLYRIRSAA
ncbi:MAG: GNAT family N-acetyltransferase [Deltaproteobacteria bacterium]|nr:GNAT family N-acetyltransferase [Deltaproteobacteria bacterium]